MWGSLTQFCGHVLIIDILFQQKTPIQETSRKAYKFLRKLTSTAISKSKRKRRVHRSFEPARNEDAPLLSMLPSSCTLSINQVEFQMKTMVESLSQVTLLDIDLTECMLSKCGWRKDRFFKEYLEDSSSLLFESGLAPEGTTTPPSSPKLKAGRGKISCPVCFLSKPTGECLSLWCEHLCCRTCWQSHVRSKMEMNEMLRLSCTERDCHAVLTKSFLVKLFGDGSEPVQKVRMDHVITSVNTLILILDLSLNWIM